MFFDTLGEFQMSPKWLIWVFVAYFILPFSVYLIVPFLVSRKRTPKRKNIAIFVLGDLGHSPRMCYHALSFSRLGYAVSLCGYLETEPPLAVLDDPRVDIVPIRVVHNLRNLPYLLFALVKIVAQLGQLWHVLGAVPGCLHIMLQNPPAMPLLAVLLVHIRLFSPQTKLVIDWHNLNYLILNLRYQNERNLVVRLMRFYERKLGNCAWRHVTVTHAMKDFLVREFGFPESSISVLHDRPGPQFSPREDKLGLRHVIFADTPKNSRVLVSSTSFTPDEDFGRLVSALQVYDSLDAPPLVVVVTGKGPMKADFLAQAEKSAFSKVSVRLAWLSAQEYPEVLAVADLAVSLHTSLSGLDLPMKILDFFGVGVPVVTLDFPAIGELVTDGKNGLIAKKDLHTPIINALLDEGLLATLKRGAMQESGNRWEENWTRVLAPVFD